MTFQLLAKRIKRSFASAIVMGLLVAGAPVSASAEWVRVYGTGGLIMYQLQNVGRSIAEVQKLAAERQQNIQNLRTALDRCKDCPQRKQLEENLQYWLRINETISRAEHGALAASGLGQYRDFGDMYRQLQNKANSPEYWDRLRLHQRKQHLLARAKGALYSQCDREALRKPNEVSPVDREATRKYQSGRRYQLIKFRGEEFYQEITAAQACMRARENLSVAGQLASQHEIAVDLCFDLAKAARSYLTERKIILSDSMTALFRLECLRLNSQIEGEEAISRVYNGADKQRMEMLKATDFYCALKSNPIECRKRVGDPAILVTKQDKAREFCSKEFVPNTGGGAFFEYLGCLRERDPRFKLFEGYDLAREAERQRDAGKTMGK